MKIITAALLASLTLAAAAPMHARMPAKRQPIQYPRAATDSSAVDNYFGIKLFDPYRPLEDDRSEQTAAWVDAENAVTQEWLGNVPFRPAVKERLTGLYNYRKQGMPWRGNDGRYYMYVNDGLQNQSVLYAKKKLGDKKMQRFLDPNTLSQDGTVALQGVQMSPDGKLTAYIISRNGSDWVEIYVMDTKSGKLLKDHIEWAKFTGVSWHGDGFFYNAYGRPETGSELSTANEGHKVYYHRLGTAQADDELVFEDKKHPLHFHSAYVPEGEPLLFIYDSGAGVGSGLRVKDLREGALDRWTVIEPTQEYEHKIVGVRDGKIYILTPYGAERWRLMVADVDSPQREHWRELVPEGKGVLKNVEFVGPDRLALVYEEDASDRLRIYGIDGTQQAEVQLPGYGSVGISASSKVPNELFYTFTSFTSPAAVYSYDFKSGESHLEWRPEIQGIDLDEYTTEQVFFPSKDGTQIPMFLTYKKGLERGPQTPTYIYGYGGFNNSLPPNFSPARMLWLDNGGVYAQVNLRGGAEYGEAWHRAGTKLEKQNVFDDFIGAAEYLIAQKQTSPAYIAVEGASNGGLLVGAVVNQRPELYAVAIPRVGVMDMMRYHLFTIGWNWAADYGRSDDSPEMAKYLLGYSPLHNVRGDGTEYPAILVTTADHDDRVVPAHSFKYAATLQEADTGRAPKLIRIDRNAGHGGGKPVGKVIDEWTDIYTFIFQNMGLQPK